VYRTGAFDGLKAARKLKLYRNFSKLSFNGFKRKLEEGIYRVLCVVGREI
jgi:hypothetical protein